MKNVNNLFVLFLLFSLIEIKAQNYSPIVTGNTSLFQIEFNGDYALHVDSITTDPKGTAYHFSKTWSEQTETCNTYYQSLWTGPKCIVSEDTCYFFNAEEDTITFIPSAELNTKWIVYRYPNGSYIEGEIIGKEKYTNSEDSISILQLQVKTANGTNINYSSTTPTGMRYVFSKTQGILELTNFNTFPNELSRYTLRGMTTNPQDYPVSFMTPRTIFNYEVGDEFHYENYYSNPPPLKEIKLIRKVIAASGSVEDDEVTYTFQQRTEKQVEGVTTYVVDTVVETHHLNLPVYYPEQAILENNPSSFYYGMSSFGQLYELNSAHGFTQFITRYEGIVQHQDCWNFSNALVWNLNQTIFVDGVGLFSRFLTYVGGFNETENLVYYKKGPIEYGVPLILSTLSKASDVQLSLFPNPLKQGEQLAVHSANFHATAIVLYNMTGNKVLEKSANGSDAQSFDLSELQPGLYLVKLVNEKNEYATSKLMLK